MPTMSSLPESIDSPGLRELFETRGVVRSAIIAGHSETWRSTGVGFVEMAFEEGRMAAIALLNHRKHNGDVLSVCWIASPKNRAADRRQMFGPMNMISDDVAGKKSDQR